KIIAHRRGDIQSGPVIEIRFRALISKNVLKMICPKRTTVLPLRVAEAIPFANSDPTMAADRLPRSGVGLLKPWDHKRGFRLELAVRDIVIWQRAVEGILPGDEGCWNVIPARARLRVVCAAVIRCPIKIPRTLVVRYRIVSACLFPYPEHRRDNIHFPWIPLDCRAGTGRDKDLRFHFQQRLLPQLHRVLREIRRRSVRRSGLFVPEDFRGASNYKNETNREKSLQANRRVFYPIPRP